MANTNVNIDQMNREVLEAPLSSIKLLPAYHLCETTDREPSIISRWDKYTMQWDRARKLRFYESTQRLEQHRALELEQWRASLNLANFLSHISFFCD